MQKNGVSHIFSRGLLARASGETESDGKKKVWKKDIIGVEQVIVSRYYQKVQQSLSIILLAASV